MGNTLLDFKGRIYIRPLGRGIVLETRIAPEPDLYLDDALARALGDDYSLSGGAHVRVHILVERLAESVAKEPSD